jgi:hypothetical protein
MTLTVATAKPAHWLRVISRSVTSLKEESDAISSGLAISKLSRE